MNTKEDCLGGHHVVDTLLLTMQSYLAVQMSYSGAKRYSFHTNSYVSKQILFKNVIKKNNQKVGYHNSTFLGLLQSSASLGDSES